MASFITDVDKIIEGIVLNEGSPSTLRTWMAITILTIAFVLPMVWGAMSAFFFFIRNQNRKIWAISIAIVSIWGICQAIYSLYISVVLTKLSVNNTITLPLLEAENQYAKAVLLIAIYMLLLYQTYTLYQKRVFASADFRRLCTFVLGLFCIYTLFMDF
ncbi:hypothetical protein [Butyrivibrio sp. NC2002]|uniref:hypothetical protein n=1 Tax=Butyrivibrio sp. NC2002 TaxID=1410610 RepID=UPI0012DBD08A|nr:hypothetical protein [Butyrivibrio sp. NC2002]